MERATVPFTVYNQPEPEVTEEMVTAAMRAFEPFAARLLRYPEKDRWHLNDIQGMRHAIKAALKLLPR